MGSLSRLQELFLKVSSTTTVDNVRSVLQPLRMALPYTGPDDFQPVIKLADIANVLAVRADSAWKTVGEFVAEAKKRPGAMRISTAGLRIISKKGIEAVLADLRERGVV